MASIVPTRRAAAAAARSTPPLGFAGTSAASSTGGYRECPPVDVYTDDSSVCTAGVHAGVITFKDGGPVTIEILAGQATYEGTERNGATTSAYGEWAGSFRVLT
jgi:hypothetical protein